jgi:hypothetical protein
MGGRRYDGVADHAASSISASLFHPSLRGDSINRATLILSSSVYIQ